MKLVHFLVVFGAIFALLTVMLKRTYWFPEFIGFISVAIEVKNVWLKLKIILRRVWDYLNYYQTIEQNQQLGSGINDDDFLFNWDFSTILILSWFFGDLFKTIYYIHKVQPTQFIICGIAQLSVDILILLQIRRYSENEPYERLKNIY